MKAHARLLCVVWATSAVFGCAQEKATVAEPAGLPNRDDAQFLRIEGPLARSRLTVTVLVDGAPTFATFDTGATKTTISTGKLDELGLHVALPEAPTHTLTDAHGTQTTAYLSALPSITAAGRWFENHPTIVVKDPRPFFLLGYDIIHQFDVVIAGNEGVVAMYAPGTITPAGQSAPVRLSDDGRSLLVDVSAMGAQGVANASLIVDTGADITTFPGSAAMLAGVATDLRFQTLTRGVASLKEEPGYYNLNPLRVGDVNVGRVVALETLDEKNALFGIDIMRRFQTTITSSLAGPPTMSFLPLPERGHTVEPVKGRCADAIDPTPDDGGACIDVRLRTIAGRDNSDDMSSAFRGLGDDIALAQMGITNVTTSFSRNDSVCLAVHVRSDVARRRVEVVMRERAGSDDFAGERIGAIVDMRHGGRLDTCLPLPVETASLWGLRASVPLVIEAVRVDGAVQADICPLPACVVARGQVYGVGLSHGSR